MAGHLKIVRRFAMLMALLLSISLSACITYLPREEGSGTGGTQSETETESEAEETDNATDKGIETDSKGFPNQPEDDQTKRY